MYIRFSSIKVSKVVNLILKTWMHNLRLFFVKTLSVLTNNVAVLLPPMFKGLIIIDLMRIWRGASWILLIVQYLSQKFKFDLTLIRLVLSLLILELLTKLAQQFNGLLNVKNLVCLIHWLCRLMKNVSRSFWRSQHRIHWLLNLDRLGRLVKLLFYLTHISRIYRLPTIPKRFLTQKLLIFLFLVQMQTIGRRGV